jgi:hypothetical protein
LAVIELLDDLREVIWERYQRQLCDRLREQRCTHIRPDPSGIDETAPPF